MARVTLRGEARWGTEGLQTELGKRDHRIAPGESVGLDSPDLEQEPMEAVLGALGASLARLAGLLANDHEVELRGFRVQVEGDLEQDGYWEKPLVRPGFQEIRCRYEIDSPSSGERVQSLVEHIQRACPVMDSLRHGASLRLMGWVAWSRTSR